MTMFRRAFATVAMLASASLPALGQTTERNISLKGGESADVGTAYYVVNCRSILKGDPSLDVMEAPPNVTVTLRKEKVVPRSSNCGKPVSGGTLVVSAPKDVKARTEGRLTVRVDYETLDGKRQSTREFNVIIFP